MSAVQAPAPRIRSVLGVLGLIVGMFGLSASPHVAEALRPPEPPPPKLSGELAETGKKLLG